MVSDHYRKKLLLYGVGNTFVRKNVERYLDSRYEIVGYSDSFYDEDIIQGCPFFRPQDISALEELEGVVICAGTKENQASITQYLSGLSIPNSIITAVTIPIQANLRYTPDLKYEIRKKHWNCLDRTIVLGLSYSLRGIDINNLIYGEAYDFSWHGLDLFYNCKMAFDALKTWATTGEKYKVLLVIPYYYFDYDMSGSLYQFQSGQIFAVRKYGFHNAYKSENQDLQNYLSNYILFGKRFFKDNNGTRFYRKNHDNKLCDELKLGGVWINDREDVYLENISLLKQLLKVISMHNGELKVIVPPFYFSPLLSDEQLDIVSKKRERFYNAIGNSVDVYDWFDIFTDSPELFADNEHLNEAGRAMFTKKINESIADWG